MNSLRQGEREREKQNQMNCDLISRGELSGCVFRLEAALRSVQVSKLKRTERF